MAPISGAYRRAIRAVCAMVGKGWVAYCGLCFNLDPGPSEIFLLHVSPYPMAPGLICR